MKKNTKKPIVLYEGERREVVIYRDGDNAPKVEVLLQQENLWLTQKAIATLFGVERSVVTKHI
ncbi:MAG: cell filamentation protein Fic, partial [Candidatus Symbiothrix sp.]|nr:cell filamentation protein Fic [Candidatus Symbiothrix sp.]